MTSIIEPVRYVVIENGLVVFPNHGNYQIGLDQVDTPEKLLGWINHLSLKNWFKGEIIERFVTIVSRHHKMGVPQNV